MAREKCVLCSMDAVQPSLLAELKDVEVAPSNLVASHTLGNGRRGRSTSVMEGVLKSHG